MFYADVLRKLFTNIKYSQRGSSARIREETTFMYFVEYLDDCEGGKVLITTIMYLMPTLASCQLMHKQKKQSMKLMIVMMEIVVSQFFGYYMMQYS